MKEFINEKPNKSSGFSIFGLGLILLIWTLATSLNARGIAPELSTGTMGIGLPCVASALFAFLAALSVFRRTTASTGATVIAIGAGLVYSCAGGLVRDIAILERTDGGLPGSFNSPPDLICVAIGILCAKILAGRPRAQWPGDGVLKAMDLASGVVFVALGVNLAASQLEPAHVWSFEALVTMFCGYITACGGGLVLTLIRTDPGHRLRFAALINYGGVMFLCSAGLTTLVSMPDGTPASDLETLGVAVGIAMLGWAVHGEQARRAEIAVEPLALGH